MWVFPGYPLSLILTALAIALLLYFGHQVFGIKAGRFKLTVINFMIMYFIIVGSAIVFEVYLDYKVSTFDLNEDGFFSKAESTYEYLKYSSQLTNDVGRSYAPVTGFLFSFICSVLFYGCLWASDYIRKKRA